MEKEGEIIGFSITIRKVCKLGSLSKKIKAHKVRLVVSKYKSDELFETPSVEIDYAHEANWGKEGYTQTVALPVVRPRKKSLGSIVGKRKNDSSKCLVLFTLCSANPNNKFSYRWKFNFGDFAGKRKFISYSYSDDDPVLEVLITDLNLIKDTAKFDKPARIHRARHDDGSSVETIQLLTTDESSTRSSSTRSTSRSSRSDSESRRNKRRKSRSQASDEDESSDEDSQGRGMGKSGSSSKLVENELDLPMSSPNSNLFRCRLRSSPPIVQSTYKIIVVGTAATGKSSLIRLWENMESCIGKSTLLDCVDLYYEVEGNFILVKVYDTAGQERFSSLTAGFYRDAHGVVLLYDVTNRDSFQKLEKWIADARHYAPDAIYLLIGNKLDLAGYRREVRRSEGLEVAKRSHCPFIETSCMNHTNCESSLLLLLQDVYQKFPVTESAESFPQEEGCFAIRNCVQTSNGLKTIGELDYQDLIYSPRGFSRILYLKEVKGKRPCVKVGNCILTPNHLVYNSLDELEVARLSGIKESAEHCVRAVIVSGDSFYCEGQLVSSHTHAKQFVYLSPILEYTPPCVISFFDRNFCPLIESFL